MNSIISDSYKFHDPFSTSLIRRLAHKVIVLLSIMTLPCCVYQLAYHQYEKDNLPKKIAIEAVYDVAHQMMPREIVWEELQFALTRDPLFEYSPLSGSDHLLRVKLTKAQLTPAGTILSGSLDKNLIGNSSNYSDDLKPLDQIDSRAVSSEYTQGLKWEVVAECELYKVSSKELKFKKVYRLNETFLSYDLPYDPSTEYLRMIHKSRADIRSLSKDLAGQVFQDLKKNKY